MMFYISMKCHENILNGFQVIEQIQNHHCRISKANKSTNVLTIDMVIVFRTSSDEVLYFYEVS